MRRLTAAAALACLLAASGATLAAAPATAQPSPSEPPGEDAPEEIEVPDPVPGEEQCAVTDPRLVQLSGLVATEDGYVTVNDSVALGLDDRLPIFFLNDACEVVDEQGYLPGRPFDPEDLALDRDQNVLWVGDTGDNAAGGTADGQPRPTVALWKVDLEGDRTPVIHRFVYEDGTPRDAEALVLDGDGTPIIITKAVGSAELFRPTDFVPDNPPEQAVPLEKLGELEVPDTGGEHELLPSAAASRAITGGANSPDGETVALRTYTDALEYDVTDGDVVTALTEGRPRVTPLPDEPWGEAITYSPDGERFLTVSEVPEGETEFAPPILAYTPTPPPEPEPPAEDAADGGDDAGGGFSLINDVQDIINLIAAVGVLGLLLVVAGVVGIVRARRRGAEQGAAEEDDEDDAGPVTGRARLSADPPPVAGPGPEPAGGVYSSAAVHGGAEYGSGGYPDEATQPAQGEYWGGHYEGGADYGPAEQGGAYRGGEYGGGHYPAGYDAGYQPEGYPADGYQAGTYQAGGYEPGYGGADHRQAGYPPAEYHGGGYGHDYHDGGYAGGGYQEPTYDQGWSGDPRYGHDGGRGGAPQPNAPDYYSDDPDYPYEFRDPNRW